MKATNQLFQAILANLDHALLSPKAKLHLEAMNKVADIVSYETLPSQIDYRAPQRKKAEAANEFLLALPNYKKYFRIIEKQIAKYYAPTENGYSAAEMNEMM